MEERLKSCIAYELLVLPRKIDFFLLKYEIADTVKLNEKLYRKMYIYITSPVPKVLHNFSF